MNMIKDAAEYAERVHAGQFRRDGRSYYQHLDRVARAVVRCGGDDVSVAAAYLHDSVEDGKTTLFDISRVFGTSVGTLVAFLTHTERQTYEQYIDMVRMNREATLIKVCDIIDNLNDQPKPGSVGRYAEALRVLLPVLTQ